MKIPKRKLQKIFDFSAAKKNTDDFAQSPKEIWFARNVPEKSQKKYYRSL